MRASIVPVLLVLVPSICSAGIQVTAECDALKGTKIDYGMHPLEHWRAADNPTSDPTGGNHFAGPYDTDIAGRSIFVIYEVGETFTIRLLSHARSSGRDLMLIAHTGEVITALDPHPGRNGSVTLYSLYPHLGVLFASQHHFDIEGSEASEAMLSAMCTFRYGPK